MKPLYIVATLVITLTGCKTTSTITPVVKPILTPADSELLRSCLGPVEVPPRALTQQQIERLWITDRQRIIECARRHQALAEWIKRRDALLMGEAQ